MKRDWKPREYGILSENCIVEDVVRLLGRSVEEVHNKIREMCESTFEGWYRRRRDGVSTDTPSAQSGRTCHGAPESPEQVLRWAWKICRKNFRGLGLVDGDVEYHVWMAAKHAFRYFNPEVGHQNDSIQKRFMRLFRHQFVNQLVKEQRNLQKRVEQLYYDMPGFADLPLNEVTNARGDNEWYLWKRHLFREALKCLDQRARKVTEMRLLEVPDKAIAKHFGISPKTLSNRYSGGRIAKMLQQSIQGLVLALPFHHLQAIVAYLMHEVGLASAEIAKLLCLPTPPPAKLLRLSSTAVVPVPRQVAALMLLRSEPPRRRAT